MAQPLAIYASIPADHPAGPHWLKDETNIHPVSVSNSYQQWPNFEWSYDGIIPTLYSEIPDYLWSIPVADMTDGVVKHFSRRLVTGENFSTTTIPEGKYCFLFSIAADDEYEHEILLSDFTEVHPLENEGEGSNFGLPSENSWNIVKTYVYGIVTGIEIKESSVLDISVKVRNIPVADIYPPGTNPAMFTWLLQIFSLE